MLRSYDFELACWRPAPSCEHTAETSLAFAAALATLRILHPNNSHPNSMDCCNTSDFGGCCGWSSVGSGSGAFGDGFVGFGAAAVGGGAAFWRVEDQGF